MQISNERFYFQFSFSSSFWRFWVFFSRLKNPRLHTFIAQEGFSCREILSYPRFVPIWNWVHLLQMYYFWIWDHHLISFTVVELSVKTLLFTEVKMMVFDVVQGYGIILQGQNRAKDTSFYIYPVVHGNLHIDIQTQVHLCICVCVHVSIHACMCLFLKKPTSESSWFRCSLQPPTSFPLFQEQAVPVMGNSGSSPESWTLHSTPDTSSLWGLHLRVCKGLSTSLSPFFVLLQP